MDSSTFHSPGRAIEFGSSSNSPPSTLAPNFVIGAKTITPVISFASGGVTVTPVISFPAQLNRTTASTETTPTPSSDTAPSLQIPSSTTQQPPISTQSVMAQSRLTKAPVGAIVGGVVGALVLLLIVVVLCVFRRRRRQRRREREILTDIDPGYPAAYPIDINLARPDLSKTLTGVPCSSQPLASSSSEIRAPHNTLIASALPKRERPGPMDTPQMDVLQGEPSDERTDLGDQANATSGAEMAIPDIMEEVRLMRVLIRAIENRHQLTAVVADKGEPSRINANDNVDPPPEYEDY